MTTLVTIVTGRRSDQREAAIAARLTPNVPTALILEGLPGGTDLFAPLRDRTDFSIVRVAPGCPCCIGNLTLRVTLNRILRQHPHQLYLGIADASHLDTLRNFLSSAPYDKLLRITDIVETDNS